MVINRLKSSSQSTSVVIFYIFLILLLFIPIYLFGEENKIERLLQTKKEIESSAQDLNKQYQDVTNHINRLKSKGELNILEEAELLNLMAQAQSISNQMEKKYGEIETIELELKKNGVEINPKKSEILKLRITDGAQFEGPAELREKVLILKDKEEKLKMEIQRLEIAEKKARLREESNAFIKEHSLFDEDSVMAVVKKNVKGVAEGSTVLPGSKGDKKIGETSYDNTETLTLPSGDTPQQDIKIRIEVTYEKGGLLNQINVGKDRSFFIDIDPGANPDELREKIELLKKIYGELSLKRTEIEKRAFELEKIFREKKK